MKTRCPKCGGPATVLYAQVDLNGPYVRFIPTIIECDARCDVPNPDPDVPTP